MSIRIQTLLDLGVPFWRIQAMLDCGSLPQSAIKEYENQ